jgi:zinc transporter 9
MSHSSKRAVVTAIVSNGIVTILKFGAASISGSASMMNEAIHSLMDTANQGFLFRGLQESERPADAQYAFGHGQKKYLWNLWSAIGLFSIGAGLGLAHAWHAWHAGAPHAGGKAIQVYGFQVHTTTITLAVLIGALLLEGYSFVIASRQFLREMRTEDYRNPLKYLWHSDDPTLVAVVLEDSIAMVGLAFAALGIGLAAYTGDYHWDIAFSVLIAMMLGMIAIFLGMVNMRYLADVRDAPAEAVFAEVVQYHPEVERFHDLRSIVLDDNNTILVAEVELREETVISGLQKAIEHHEKQMLDLISKERSERPSVREYIHNRAAVQATLERTEQIIEELVDSIKKKLPRISHVTIEVEGIATRPDTDI